MSDYIDGDASVGDTDPELVPVKIPVPDAFATGEAKFSPGITFMGETGGPEAYSFPPGSTIYPTMISSNPSQIRLMVNGRELGNVVNPYNTVCSGGGFPLTIMSNPSNITYSVPSSLHGWWQIVQAVAETESVYGADLDHDDRYIHHYCPFCDGVILTSDYARGEPFPHDQDCIVLKARAMVQAMPHVEAKK